MNSGRSGIFDANTPVPALCFRSVTVKRLPSKRGRQLGMPDQGRETFLCSLLGLRLTVHEGGSSSPTTDPRWHESLKELEVNVRAAKVSDPLPLDTIWWGAGLSGLDFGLNGSKLANTDMYEQRQTNCTWAVILWLKW